MKALQIVKPYEFRIIEIEEPHPENNEVVIQLEYAAICNQNDYKFFYGMYGDILPYPLEPGAFGHEGVGIVTEVGKGVENFKEGDRVVMMGEGGPMLFREYVLRKADTVIPINKKVPPQEAAILELFGCAYHALEIAGDVGEKKVAISGLGPAGLSILQILMLRNPLEIIGIEVSEKRREAAEKLGLKRTFNPLNKDEFQRLIEEVPDLVIDATGVPQAMLNSFEITKKEVLLFGFTNEKFEVDESVWFRKEMVIKLSNTQTIDDLREVVRLLEEGKIKTREFISGVMPFSDYDKAVEKVYKKEAIKVLLEWRQK